MNNQVLKNAQKGTWSLTNSHFLSARTMIYEGMKSIAILIAIIGLHQLFTPNTCALPAHRGNIPPPLDNIEGPKSDQELEQSVDQKDPGNNRVEGLYATPLLKTFLENPHQDWVGESGEYGYTNIFLSEENSYWEYLIRYPDSRFRVITFSNQPSPYDKAITFRDLETKTIYYLPVTFEEGVACPPRYLPGELYEDGDDLIMFINDGVVRFPNR